jgi:hypothetical protein
MGFYRGPNIVTDGLIYAIDAGSERSYPGTGTTATSLVGSDTGTLTNGVGFSSNNGGYWEFDGADDYIINTDTYNLSNFTAEVWVYPTTTPASGTMASAISTVYPGTNSTVNYAIGWNSNYGWMGGFFNSSSGGWHQIDVTSPALNTWHSYSLTYNGTTLILYHNGVSEGTLATTDIAAGGGPIRVGRRWDTTNYFPGNIPSARVYNRALTATEISQNFNAQKSRFGL